MEQSRIDLAHAPDFAIGELAVHPSTRELSRDGERSIIEPRVMQVLVALSRAGGAVVSKDDLAISCWEGRVVGEDAINRVLSRLRRVSEGIGKGAFRVETVTRVGYRLVADRQIRTQSRPAAHGAGGDRHGMDRRSAVAASAVAALVASGGWLFYNREPAVPAGLSALIDKADAALNYQSPEQNDAAVAIMKEASRRYPDRAEAWGRLAVAYRQASLNGRRPEVRQMLDLAQAAARRAVEIDPANGDGAVITAVGNGIWYASYRDYDRITRDALARFPEHDVARRTRSMFLFETGQIRKSIAISKSLIDARLPSPGVTSHAIKLWSAGRPDEAEALLDVLIARWPRHFSVWSSRFRFLLFSGRFKQAGRMLDEQPVGLDPIDIEIWTAQTKALKNLVPADIAAALKLFDGVASTIMSKAQEAAAFASAIGRVDAAFGYLDRHYQTGAQIRAFRQGQAAKYPHSGTPTFFLFEPPLAAVRADMRFPALCAQLGLTQFWQDAGITPDYLA